MRSLRKRAREPGNIIRIKKIITELEVNLESCRNKFNTTKAEECYTFNSLPSERISAAPEKVMEYPCESLKEKEKGRVQPVTQKTILRVLTML